MRGWGFGARIKASAEKHCASLAVFGLAIARSVQLDKPNSKMNPANPSDSHDIDLSAIHFSSQSRRPRHHHRSLSGVTPRELKYIYSVLPSHLRQKWKKYSVKPIESEEEFDESFVREVETTLGRSLYNVDTLAAYQASAISIRNSLIAKWNRTQQKQTLANPKRIYYLSLEWLMGRAMDNAITNMDIKETVAKGLEGFGFRLEDVLEREPNAGLGNGGLGRLAACYIDSLATLNYPVWGYGLRYKYGIFCQKIIDGNQVEYPDTWLEYGNPWEIPRHELTVDIQLYGEVDDVTDAEGQTHRHWIGNDIVEAKAYDMPIPGFQTENVSTLRLWEACPNTQFDFAKFNEGQYNESVQEQIDASIITSVLYPNDNFYEGKELRLKQQYFWVAASLSDIVRRFKRSGKPLSQFSEYTAIQLNDTHPTLAILELLRILVDKEGLDYADAWDITQHTFAYTNHTVMQEALEKWPVTVFGSLLPRHLELAYKINYYFLEEVAKKFPGDDALLQRVSIFEESNPKQIRMAYLAVIGSHMTNGVAELHSDLIQTTIFKDFVKIFGPERFTNVTNGITPRRWLLEANPVLAALIANKLGSFNYLKDLNQLVGIGKYVNDKAFRQKWAEIKLANKKKLIELLEKQYNKKLDIDPHALFDVQVKRIHEYKRQQLNIFGVIARYISLKKLTAAERAKVVPRVHIFGGKSAPGYYMAKNIIKLINAVAEVLNNDKDTNVQLKVLFVEEYNVSKSQILVAASDVSEHISTAGTEASGTSNMKFVLNGGLIVGTVDGANIEIGREVGKENVFFFGHLAESVDSLRAKNAQSGVKLCEPLAEVFDMIRSNHFGPAEAFKNLLGSVQYSDHYLVNDDFEAYVDVQNKVSKAFQDKEKWLTKSITVVSKMGFFSSDRAVQEYAQNIWQTAPVAVETSHAGL